MHRPSEVESKHDSHSFFIHSSLVISTFPSRLSLPLRLDDDDLSKIRVIFHSKKANE